MKFGRNSTTEKSDLYNANKTASEISALAKELVGVLERARN
jgi:hypothetical protein